MMLDGSGEAGKAPRLVPGLAVRAGQTVAGKYRIEGLLGTGGSGVSLLARNIHLQEPVVLKILASFTDRQSQLVKRRLERARQASRLRSAHVGRILDIGVTADALPYIATESLEGRTLEDELEEHGKLPIEEAVRWALEACAGLAEAHAAGLYHGDLKPKNIFLVDATDARPRHLKVLDFGTTSPLEGIGDQTASAFFGSPAFVAPEQIQDPTLVDARVDLWALGVLLYQMISGKLPFEADSVSGMIVAVVYDEPGLLSDAPYELAILIDRCLQKDPDRRPSDVGELADGLAAFAGGMGRRLSERVAFMLDQPPASMPAQLDPEETGSFAPLSLSNPAPPRVAAPKRAAFRWRTLAGLAAATMSVGLLAYTAIESARQLPAQTATPTTELVSTTVTAAPVPAAPDPNAPQAVLEAAESAEEPAPAPAEASPEEPVVSFAPTQAHPATPTPLVVATASSPLALPAAAAPPPLHHLVSAGIPTTREALPLAIPPNPYRR